MTIQGILELMKKNILATLGIVGLIGGIIFSFTKGSAVHNPSHQLNLPASSPFENNISGIGFLEASSRNISVGSFVPGVVKKVLVNEGDIVKAEDSLLIFNSQVATAQVAIDEKSIKSAEYSVEISKASFGYATDILKRAKKLKPGILTQEEVVKREFDAQKAEAQFNLDKAKLEEAKKKLALSKAALDNFTIYAPVDGIILKIFIKSGEYVSDSTQNPLLTMGTNKPLHVRVQIDENDAWRFDAKAKAVAYLRSNKNISLPLNFVRIDPFAISKQQLSGSSKDLVDTRILEIVYKVESEPKNVFIGQQLDVFIEAKS